MNRKFLACGVIAAGTCVFSAVRATAQAQSPVPTQPATQNVCPAHCIPEKNTTYIDPQGTAHVTRVIPVPPTVSPEAQKFIARPVQDIPGAPSALNVWEDQDQARIIFPKIYPVHLSDEKIAGVPVHVVTPLSIPAQNRDKVLINLHGGGFMGDGGSWTETIPVSYLTQTKGIAILYRLTTDGYAFPAQVDDVVAVYKQLLKRYKPRNMAMFGTSAGAMLVPEVCVRLRQLGLPLPGALGIFAGQGDFTTAAKTDSQEMYTQDGLGHHKDTPTSDSALRMYTGKTNLKDPVLSPLFADLRGFPPSLFLTSTRDMMLSGTVILHRAFLRSGVDAQLVVFEALSHGFWEDPYLPESKEAFEIMASFFASKLDLTLKQPEPYRWGK
jgi:acetyl esterase/lipase